MTSFSFKTDISPDFVTIKARGYLSRTGGEVLEQEIKRLLGDGQRRFLINFGETDLINSVGISILIGVIERVRELGGDLAFSELTPVNEEIFRIMGLHRHARLLKSDGDAIAAGKDAVGGEGRVP